MNLTSEGLGFSTEDSVLLLMMWEHRVAAESVAGWMHHQVLYPSSFLASTFAGVGPCDCEEGLQRDSGPMLLTEAEKSQPATSPRNFLQRKGKVSKEVWSWRTLSRGVPAGTCTTVGEYRQGFCTQGPWADRNLNLVT